MKKLVLSMALLGASFSAFANYSAEEKGKLNAVGASLTSNQTAIAMMVGISKYYATTVLVAVPGSPSPKAQYCQELNEKFGPGYNEFAKYAQEANSVLVSNDAVQIKQMLTSMIDSGLSAITNCSDLKASYNSLSIFNNSIGPLQQIIGKINSQNTPAVSVNDFDRVTPGISKLVFTKEFKFTKGKMAIFISKETGKKCELSLGTSGKPLLIVPAGTEMPIHNRFDGVPNYGLYLLSERSPGDMIFALGCASGLSVDQVMNTLLEAGITFKDIK